MKPAVRPETVSITARGREVLVVVVIIVVGVGEKAEEMGYGFGGGSGWVGCRDAMLMVDRWRRQGGDVASRFRD